MKRVPIFVASIISAVFLWSCSLGNGTVADLIEPDYSKLGPIVAAYFPAREGDTIDNRGLVRADGSMLFSNKFPGRISASVNGFFTAEEGSGLSVYRAAAMPVKVDGLANLAYAGAMSHGLMPVTRKGARIELVDGEGTVRMELTSIGGKEIVKTSPYIVDGLLAVCSQDGLWGAMNTTGEMVLEPVYDNEPHFSEQIAWVSKTYDKDLDSVRTTSVTDYFLVNNKGRVIFTFPSGVKPIGQMKGGRMAIRLPGGKNAMLTTSGKVNELSPRIKKVQNYDKDYLIWRDASDKAGLSDFTGLVLVEPSYRNIELADSGRILTDAFNGTYAIADRAAHPYVRFNGFDAVKSLRYPAAGIVSPFLFAGSGFAGIVLLDNRGHRLGHGPFVSVESNVTLLEDGYVHTDFFNPQATVHAILSKISDRGWGRASLGQVMAQLADSLTASTGSVKMIKFEKDNPYMVSVEATAYTDRAMAKDSLRSDGESRVFYADSAARVKYIKVEAKTTARRFPDLIQHVGGELVPHGFRAEKLRDEYGVYVSSSMVVIIAPRPGLAGADFYFMDRAFYEEVGERIIGDAERVYNQSLNKLRS